MHKKIDRVRLKYADIFLFKTYRKYQGYACEKTVSKVIIDLNQFVTKSIKVMNNYRNRRRSKSLPEICQHVQFSLYLNHSFECAK